MDHLSTGLVSDSAPRDLEDKTAPEENPSPENNDSESDSERTDSDSDSESSEEEDNNNDSNENDDNNDDGLCEYERLRLLRIQRNQAHLQRLGLLDTKITNPSSQKKVKQKSTTSQHNSEPARRQPKREVKGKIPQEQLDLRTLVWASGGKSKKKSSKTRCGACAGCTRENDCNTCVYCVKRKNGNIKARRCIFKACRNNSNRKIADVQQPNDSEQTRNDGFDDETLQEQEHSDHCDVCQNGGDLILCNACPRAFHSNCHWPKIKKLPAQDDVWLCMECNPRFQPNGFLLALLPDTTKLLKVKVIEPPPQCLVCHDSCADPESIQCKACDNHFHLTCNYPPLDTKPKGGAARVWKCTTCKESNAPLLEQYVAAPKTLNKKKLKLFEGEHDDDCYICFNGGELVCCDFCPKVFHRDCHIPALPAIPTGIWK